jgi:hypothetical protein
MNNEYDKKKAILKDIILKEEDVLAQLQRIVKLATPFLKIEEKTGRIVLSNDFEFANADKIFLLLLGKYLSYHSEIAKEISLDMQEISNGLGIVSSTLSAPLGRLVKKHFVNKPKKNEYCVNPYKIEEMLQEITVRYPQH